MPSSERAPLTAIDAGASADGLAAARQPLATRPPAPAPEPHREPHRDVGDARIGPHAVTAADVIVLPSVDATPAREPMVSLTVRLPLSMSQWVEDMCANGKVDKSKLIRDCIDHVRSHRFPSPPRRAR